MISKIEILLTLSREDLIDVEAKIKEHMLRLFNYKRIKDNFLRPLNR